MLILIRNLGWRTKDLINLESKMSVSLQIYCLLMKHITKIFECYSNLYDNIL